jgi:nucleoside-diphosphate-sugar epimerase
MKNILITGSSGFFGTILFKKLSDLKYSVIGLDLKYSKSIAQKKQIICDLTNFKDLNNKLKDYKFEIIIHLAAQIDFSVKDQSSLFYNNIISTKNICEFAKKNKVKKFIFTSSNSIFLGLDKKIIYKNDHPKPIDMYGKSKLIAEKTIQKYKRQFQVNILRCPIIIDKGRAGMLTILFEIIKSNAVLWVLDKGKIKHQLLYANDLTNIICKLFKIKESFTLNIASGKADSFYNIFINLIKNVKSKSKIISLPSIIIIPLLKLLFFLKLSPLGPYQFRMLTKNFEFDLSDLKKKLKFKQSKKDYILLSLAYKHFIKKNTKFSKNNSNNSKINFGLLEILKYIKF